MSLLPPAGRERFVAEYGAIDDETQVRARVLAISLCAMLAVYARSVGHTVLERESIEGLERAVAER